MASWHASRLVAPLSVPLRVFLIRHGQSEANLRHDLISGRQAEVPLTPLGIEQAKALGEYFLEKSITIDRKSVV